MGPCNRQWTSKGLCPFLLKLSQQRTLTLGGLAFKAASQEGDFLRQLRKKKNSVSVCLCVSLCMSVCLCVSLSKCKIQKSNFKFEIKASYFDFKCKSQI